MTAAEVCREVVEATHTAYRRHHASLGERGYHVMYGPPKTESPILFIGYQPGGSHRTDDHLRDIPRTYWPEVSYYATESWRLAAIMRAMFGETLLRDCTGLNAIFFRSPNVATYASEVPLQLRRELADFCLAQATRVVAALRPKMVVGIGFESLRLFGPTNPALNSANGRVLVEAGDIGATPAFATLHLSGARISTSDRAAIASFVAARRSDQQ
jgi:hypothetical protein